MTSFIEISYLHATTLKYFDSLTCLYFYGIAIKDVDSIAKLESLMALLLLRPYWKS